MESSVSYLRCLSFYIEDDKYTNIISDIDNAVLEYEEVLNVSDKDLIFSKFENLYSILNEHTTKLKKYFKDFDADDFIKNELFIDNQINKEKQSFIEKEIIKAYLYEKYLFDFYGTVSLYTKITKNELVKQGRNYDDLIPMAMLEEGGNDEIGMDRNVVKIYVYSDGTISEKRDSSLSKISFNCLKDTSGFDWSAKGYDVNMSLENEFNFSIDREEDEEGVESVPVENTREDEIIERIISDAQNNDFASILSNFNFDEFELNLDILLDSKKNAYIQDFNFLFFILCAIVMQMRENEKEDVDDSSRDIIENRVQRIKSDIKSKLTEEGIENIKGFLLSAVDSPILEKIAIFFPKTKDIFNKTNEEKRTIYLSVLGEVLSADFEFLTDEKENQLLVESSCKRIEVDVSPFVESTIKKTIVLAQRESSNVDENKVRNEKMSDLPANILDEESGKAKNLEDDILSADNVENVPYRIENAELNLSRADNIDKDTNDNSASDEELDTKSEEEEISSNTAKTNDDKSGESTELPWWGITLIAIASATFASLVVYAIYKNRRGEGICNDCAIIEDGTFHTSSFFGETTNRVVGEEVVPLINALLDANNADNDAENKESDLNREMKENLLKSAEKKRAELIIDDETKTELMRFFSFEIIDDRNLKIDNLRKNQRIELLKLINTYYNNTHQGYSNRSVGINSADDYAKLFLGFNDEEIQIIKDFIKKDDSNEDSVITSSFHDNDNKEDKYLRIHNVFDNEFIKEINLKGNIKIPEYEGFYILQPYRSYSELRNVLRANRVKDQDYEVVRRRSQVVAELYRDRNHCLIPRFKYPNKRIIGFSPIAFDDEYDAKEGRDNDAYTLGKVLYLTHFFEKLKKFNTEFYQLDISGTETADRLNLYAKDVLPDNPVLLPKLKHDVDYYFKKLKTFDENYRHRFYDHQLPAMLKGHVFGFKYLHSNNGYQMRWPTSGNIINQGGPLVLLGHFTSKVLTSNIFLKILVFFMHLDFHDLEIPQMPQNARRGQNPNNDLPEEVLDYIHEADQTCSHLEGYEDEEVVLDGNLMREQNNVHEVQFQYINAVNRYSNAVGRTNLTFYSNENLFKGLNRMSNYRDLKPDVYPNTKIVKRHVLVPLAKNARTFEEVTETRERDPNVKWTGVRDKSRYEKNDHYRIAIRSGGMIIRKDNGGNIIRDEEGRILYTQIRDPKWKVRTGLWPTKETEEIDEEIHEEILYGELPEPQKRAMRKKIRKVVKEIAQKEINRLQQYAAGRCQHRDRPFADVSFTINPIRIDVNRRNPY